MTKKKAEESMKSQALFLATAGWEENVDNDFLRELGQITYERLLE